MGNAGPGAFFGGVLTTVVGSIITISSGGILTPAYVGGLMLTGAVAGGVNSALELDLNVVSGNCLGTKLSGNNGITHFSVSISGGNAIVPLVPLLFGNKINLPNVRLKKLILYKRMFNIADAQIASSLLANRGYQVSPSTIMEKYRKVEYWFVLMHLDNGGYLIAYKHHMGITRDYYPSLNQALQAIGIPTISNENMTGYLVEESIPSLLLLPMGHPMNSGAVCRRFKTVNDMYETIDSQPWDYSDDYMDFQFDNNHYNSFRFAYDLNRFCKY